MSKKDRMKGEQMDERIGTVEILVARVYPLDAEMGHEQLATTVFVKSGVYPLYRIFDTRYWMMTGNVNSRGFTRFGDGMFGVREYDAPDDGPEVIFPSRRFGPDEWRDLLADDSCQ